MIDVIKRLEELREKIKNEYPDYSEKEISAYITGMLDYIRLYQSEKR